MRSIDRLLKDAIWLLEHLSKDAGEDIHAVRIQIKQARALGRLIRPLAGKAAFKREDRLLRESARRLGPMREAAVEIETIRRLSKKKSGQNKMANLSPEQRQPTHDLSSPRNSGWEKARRAAICDLNVSRHVLRRMRLATDRGKYVGLGLEKVYRACRQRMKRAFRTNNDKSFHQWRIRLKNLYYELQFFVPIWPKRLRSMIAQLKEVQEYVGDDHDLTVLKGTLRRNPERFGDESVVRHILNRLKKRSRRLRRACRPLAEKVLQRSPHRFMYQFERHLDNYAQPDGACKIEFVFDKPRQDVGAA